MNLNTSNNGLRPRRGGEEKKEEVTRFEERIERNHPQGRNLLPSYSSSEPETEERRLKRLEMATLLKSYGVRFYSQLAKDYSPEVIAAKIAEWLTEPDLGPGMLVLMIKGCGPIVGEVEPIQKPNPMPPSMDDPDWLQQRFERQRGPATSDDYHLDEEGRWRRQS